MKKLITLLLATTFIFTACSSTENGESTTNTTGANVEDENKEVTLTVWESTGGPDEFIKQAGEAFTELHPNIKIEYVNVELGDTVGQIALDGPASVGADVFVAPHDKLGELVTAGHILPVTNPDAIKQNTLESSLKAVTYDDVMYGYPVSSETYALYYNKDLISEDNLPKNYDELKEFAKTFNSENTGKYAFLMNVGSGYYTIPFAADEGNYLFGESGTDTENTNINNEIAISGMEVFQSLREVVDYPAADLTTSFADGAFASGNVAMYMSGPWNIENFSNAGLNFGVTTLPALKPGGQPSTSFAGTRAMFVSAYSKHPEEASMFAEFLTTDEMQQLRFDITGAIPSANISVESPYINGFIAQLDYAFPMPSIPAMNNFWASMDSASANIWDGADVKTELDAVDVALKQ